LYAINPDGTLKWRYGTYSYVHSSPAIGSDGTIYVGSWDNYLYAINPNGTLKWRYLTDDDVESSPALA
jgi:outer membrane protein assembly factor BamB